MSKPNFIFIGPDKSGSSWLYQSLRGHGQVYLPDVKEIFFFDRFYDRGWSWYEGFFKGELNAYPVVGEISHDYLFSQKACQRIARDLPAAKLMVCLREPAQRAFSAYLYMVKQGRVKMDFESALKEVDELIDHGRYAKHLKVYLETFRRDRIHVATFDDLLVNPQVFFDEVCAFLDVQAMPLPDELRGNVLPASRPRLFWAARLARGAGWKLRLLGMPRLVSRVKESNLVNSVLFSTYGPVDKPKMSNSARDMLRETFSPEVQRLDRMLETNFSELWGY